MNGLLLAEYSIFLPEWEGSETELRGSAARCAEAAMPFRKPLDFYWGYAPQGGRLYVFRRFEMSSFPFIF
jgi:hypothetical protein